MADQGKQSSAGADSMSVFLSLTKSDTAQTPTDGNWKDIDTGCQIKTAFGLYTYDIKGLSSSEEEEQNGLHTDSYPYSAYSERDKNKDFRLTLLTANLTASDEAELRRFLNRKLSKGNVHSLNGNISAIDLSLGEETTGLYLCYYCSMHHKASTYSTNVIADDLADLGLEDELDLDLDIKKPSQDTGANGSNDLIMCLIAPAEAQLDLFKADLDRFSAQLLSKLDFEANEVVSIAMPMLETWFENMTSYLSQCVHRLGSELKYLIHTAIIDTQLNIICSDEELKSHIRRLFECCSLSDLLSTNGSHIAASTSAASDKASDLLVDLDTTGTSSSHNATKSSSPKTVTLKVENEKCIFENHGCTKYCEDWSLALESCDQDNPSLIRQVIENYKLKAIKDMNTLKRLLKQAEDDHYSLYRCHMFLKQCGNGPVLLHHADMELRQTSQPETAEVLLVLQENIRREDLVR